MENNIKGKVIVITGASSGFGEISARCLSNPGAIVVIYAHTQILFVYLWLRFLGFD